MAAYLQGTLQVEENLILNCGVRLDYFDMNKQTEWAPRASLAYGLPAGITLRAACGVYYQPPIYTQLRSSTPSGNNTGFEKAVHYIVGFEKEIAGNVDAKVEFYDKEYSNLIPTIRLSNGQLSYGNRQNDAVGYARGADAGVSADLGSLGIQVSYGYLDSKEKLVDSTQGYYPRYTDQKNTLSLSVIYRLSGGWSLDMRGFYGSGYAYTPYVYKYDAASALLLSLVPGAENSANYPAYERIDLTTTKGFTLFGNRMQVYLDVMNILNRKNVIMYFYTFSQNASPEVQPTYSFGLVPTMGVSYSF